MSMEYGFFSEREFEEQVSCWSCVKEDKMTWAVLDREREKAEFVD